MQKGALNKCSQYIYSLIKIQSRINKESDKTQVCWEKTLG